MAIYYVDFDKNSTTIIEEATEVVSELTPQEVLSNLVASIRTTGKMAYDLETSGLDPYVNYPLMVQVASPTDVVIFRAGQSSDFSVVGELLSDKNIRVIGHNIMFDYKFSLHHFGWHINGIWDTMLAEGCLISGRLDTNFRPMSASLEATISRHFGITLDKTTRKNFIGRPGETVFTHAELLYGAKDVSILFDLAKGQELRVNELGLEKVVRLENRFVQITAEMELNGFAVDSKTWKALTTKYEEQYLETLEKLYETFRNDNSAVQLSFFDDTIYKIEAYVKALNLKSPASMLALLKASGIEDELGWQIPDTKRETLDKMAEELEHKGVTNDKIRLVLDFRKKSKLLDAFMYKIPKMLNPITGRLHAGYIQMPIDDASGRVGGTSTGRLASRSPNFQQMPAIGELRHCFIARPGYKIITMDYASHEVRVAANYTQDPALVNFFNTDKNLPTDPSLFPVVDPNDFHGYSASLVFSLPIEKVAKSITLNEAGEHIELNPPMRNFRQLAKVATFAIFYGAKAWGLAPKLGLSEDEANDVVARYDMAYPTAIKKLTKVGYDSFGKGVVRGCIGRIKYLETNEKFKNKSMRQARNYVIQNTNAEQLKYAMFLIRNKFTFEDVRILSSVHDEIVFEVKADLAHDIAIELKELMIYGAKTVLDGPVNYDASYSIEDYWTK